MEIKKLFWEMIPVVLGVLIALLINNLNEQRKDRNYVETMVFAITEELKENKIELADLIKDRKKLLDTIYHYQGTPTSAAEIVNKVQGLGGVTIKNTAWRAMVNSRIELLDYKRISLLTDIDDQKELLELQVEKLIDHIYQNGTSTDPNELDIFGLIIESISYTENELLELHNAFIKLK